MNVALSTAKINLASALENPRDPRLKKKSPTTESSKDEKIGKKHKSNVKTEFEDLPAKKPKTDKSIPSLSYNPSPVTKKERHISSESVDNLERELKRIKSEPVATKKLSVASLLEEKKKVKTKLWSGSLVMPHGQDKRSGFRCNMYYVNGDADDMHSELTFNDLLIGGRIRKPDLWNYLEKVKKNKQIVSVVFKAAAKEETRGYLTILKSFQEKDRYGVVTNNKKVKDMYIVTLDENEPYPSQLLGAGFESGPGIDFVMDGKKHAMLLGIIGK